MTDIVERLRRDKWHVSGVDCETAAQEIECLRAELAKHQESEFHPDWSLLEATRDSLAEHQEIIRDQRERIKVLEEALRIVRQYPDFDGGGPMVDMMDSVLAGKSHPMLDTMAKVDGIWGGGNG